MLVSTRFTEPFNQPIEYGDISPSWAICSPAAASWFSASEICSSAEEPTLQDLKSTTVPTLTTAVPGDLSFVLPHRHLTSIIEALRAFDKVAPGLYSKNTLLYGVEVKFYSSKIEVNNKFETSVKNFYAIGDGAGITRGLMQASVSGIVVARDIAEKLKK